MTLASIVLFFRIMVLAGAGDLGLGLARGNAVMITGGAITAAIGITGIILLDRRP